MYKKKGKKKIGIFGGSFDPPHKGHVQIAKLSLKKLRLSYLFWTVTKKNPLKKNPMLSLKSRIFLSKKLINNNTKIIIKNFDQYLNSNKTIELLKFIKNKNKNSQLYFIMGSDNLINFHRWDKWKSFQKLCTIVIFPRKGYFKKMVLCKAYNFLRKDKIIFLKSKIVNISSSKIRKNYLL